MYLKRVLKKLMPIGKGNYGNILYKM